MNYKGSCLCGGLEFKISAFEEHIGHCHCTMCRKFHGAAFSTFGEVKLANLTWLKGKDLLKSYKAYNDTVRQFCSRCGSSLTFSSANNDTSIEIALACLDNEQGIHPDAHIYTDSKVPWLIINDNLPQYLLYRDPQISSK